MNSRSALYYDPGNDEQLNKVKLKGDINLIQGVSIAFFMYGIRAPPNNLSQKINYKGEG